jgi:Zn-dependent peptidase ImmA (M78 family)
VKPAERAVRRCAVEILEGLCVESYPVRPEAVAKRKGLGILERRIQPGVFGALAKSAGQFIILVSPDCPTAGHRRFTIAHELGHFHLPGHVEEMFAGADGVVESVAGHFRDATNRIEREADWFASEFLAPKKWAAPRIQAMEPSVRSLKNLAAEFETSLTMMALRYGELSDEAVATIVSLNGTVEWVVASGRVRDHRWSWSLRPGDPVPSRTASAGFSVDREAVTRAEERTDSGPLCAWFEKAPEDLIVEEDALGLGASGRVLTFLLIPDLPDSEELEEEDVESDDPPNWRDALRGF